MCGCAFGTVSLDFGLLIILVELYHRVLKVLFISLFYTTMSMLKHFVAFQIVTDLQKVPQWVIILDDMTDSTVCEIHNRNKNT